MEILWDEIQGGYGWNIARQNTMKATWLLHDFEKWERGGGYNTSKKETDDE